MSDLCYRWDMQQKYNFNDRGNIIVSFSMARSVCADEVVFSHRGDADHFMWIDGIAILLSLISFINVWISFHGMAEHLGKLQ